MYRQYWILKICGDIINKTLELIFKQAPITGKYLLIGKRVILVLLNKKGIRRNYYPVSLLSICQKVFERTLFNNFV